LEASAPLPPVVGAEGPVWALFKPAGLPTHPGTGHSDSLATRLADHYAQAAFKPTPAHRLDKDTSGILLVAATFSALRELQEAIRQRSLIKEYVVWVRGRWPWPEARLLRHQLRKGLERGFEKMRAVLTAAGEERALEALCLARPLRICENESLLLIRLFTGRTHQIRVQLASLGHPVLGDVKYGPPEQRVGGGPMYLHALRVILPGGRIFACLPDWDAKHAVGVLPEVMPVPAEHQGQINVEN
ncbi:MAG: RNA pseudouridine synthase, partial [Desulfovibrio fairfieldensis]|nr:RNA pseudouridine synthase [Desulfovibrio fairfieldensis]